jgi:hypothetical protein
VRVVFGEARRDCGEKVEARRAKGEKGEGGERGGEGGERGRECDLEGLGTW